MRTQMTWRSPISRRPRGKPAPIADGAGESAVVPVTAGARPHNLYTLAEPPITADINRKVELLKQVDAAARAA
jgi:hypothetical protein